MKAYGFSRRTGRRIARDQRSLARANVAQRLHHVPVTDPIHRGHPQPLGGAS